MTKLKRCPNCGGETIESWIADYPALRCDKCGIVTILPQSGAGNEKLIEVFNTRTPEIVRCAECRFFEKESELELVVAYNFCGRYAVNKKPEDFCSWGERREEK